MCSYHRYGSFWLSLFRVYSSLHVPSREIPAAASHVHLGNVWKNGENDIFPIGCSTTITTGLYTVHPKYMALYIHQITVQQIGSWGVGPYVLDIFFIGWPSFWVAARMTLIRIIFAKPRPLTFWQEMCFKVLRIVFANMSIVNSHNLRNYFPSSIILIMLPMSRRLCITTVSGWYK